MGQPATGRRSSRLPRVRRECADLCRAILREAGLPQFSIVQVDELGATGADARRCTYPPRSSRSYTGSSRKAGWETSRSGSNGSSRHRRRGLNKACAIPRPRRGSGASARRGAKPRPQQTSRPVTPRDGVTVTRGTVATTPRVPAECYLLQHHGGAKQPVG
jgi:hypothetical protein